jgi:hypothetical protein
VEGAGEQVQLHRHPGVEQPGGVGDALVAQGASLPTRSATAQPAAAGTVGPARVRRRELQAAQRRRMRNQQAQGPPAVAARTTNATSTFAEPSTSPRSGSGSAIQSHDPRDRR